MESINFSKMSGIMKEDSKRVIFMVTGQLISRMILYLREIFKITY